MKNLKIYLSIALISVLTSSIFFACSSDENQTQTTASEKKESVNKASTSKEASITSGTITCYLSGSNVINPNTNDAFSSVNAGSTTTYQYNSTPAVSNIVWSIVPGTANPAGSITINPTGSTASVTVSSSFLSASIQALGTDSTGQICGPVLPITRSTDNGGNSCCTPNMVLSFVCRGSNPTGNLGGFLTLIPPQNCPIDWQNNVSSIDFRLEGGPAFSGDDALNGKKVGTLYPPFTSLNDGKINQEFYYTGCLSRVTAKVTIHLNNGCPPIYLNAEALKK